MFIVVLLARQAYALQQVPLGLRKPVLFNINLCKVAEVIAGIGVNAILHIALSGFNHDSFFSFNDIVAMVILVVRNVSYFGGYVVKCDNGEAGYRMPQFGVYCR